MTPRTCGQDLEAAAPRPIAIAPDAPTIGRVATNPIRIDLGPEERARLEAESRRRGIDADAVIVEFVRGLPGPDADAQHGMDALARLKHLWQGVPEVGEQALEQALKADRAELEERALRGSAD